MAMSAKKAGTLVQVVNPSTNPVPVSLPAGAAGTPSSSTVVSVQGFGYRSSVTITRPSNTTLYGANDVVGQADSGTPANAGTGILTFTDIGPSGGHIFITDASLRVDLTAVPSGMTSFVLYLYDASPTAILDNAAWDLPSGDRASFLGYINLGSPADMGSTLFVQQSAINKKIKLATGSTSLYGELVTVGTYTPASGTVYTPKLHSVAV